MPCAPTFPNLREPLPILFSGAPFCPVRTGSCRRGQGPLCVVWANKKGDVPISRSSPAHRRRLPGLLVLAKAYKTILCRISTHVNSGVAQVVLAETSPFIPLPGESGKNRILREGNLIGFTTQGAPMPIGVKTRAPRPYGGIASAAISPAMGFSGRCGIGRPMKADERPKENRPDAGIRTV